MQLWHLMLSFPFPDNVEKAADLGISSIIQPGGSQNDNEVIKKANELNIKFNIYWNKTF